ncbi:hypothetical protein [Bacillus weihaiensis]|uniref:hypothetical protein n=1 Tax=Bacillus weihaiensis TaxID=1547283 RepID=UPI0023562252|nr:hypothetical protein [Bacillus weihaiensis]
MKAQREVTREEFLGLAQDGIRELFEIEQYKVFDGKKGAEQHYFVYEMKNHRCFLINLETCYELVTTFYTGDNKQLVIENLNAIALSVN